ncbi:MAG: MFS transporter [Thaumarchaeota archaeon]|nr:MFS transporter [Nitrososphaerota archaeon]
MAHYRTEGDFTFLTLGLRANLNQFIVLVVVNAFVGALVGFYALVPLIGQKEFGLTSNTVILSYIFSFGITKAFCNYYAGRLADRFGRRKLLIFGWLLAVPVPILVILAPNWWWIVFANMLLGINQGFAWSMTVIMKIDLVGPANRGLAMGLNEFAGYLAVSITLIASGYIASLYNLRPEPFYLGIGFTAAGLILSLLKVKETKQYAMLEAKQRSNQSQNEGPAPKSVFVFTTLKDRALSSSCFAGLVNNLIFGMSWGLFPLFFASKGLDVSTINFIKAFYPGVWSVLQLATGPMSDRLGRKWLIVSGQLTQAAGIWLTVFSNNILGWIVGSCLIGLGTALVYPTLLAAVSDVAHPRWRAESLGTYRFWRDVGYAVGAVFSGVLADLINIPFSINMIGLLTVASALLVAFRMYETIHSNKAGDQIRRR